MKRSNVKIYFADSDISEDIMKYFLSLSYTDNSEDEADDLQIKLTDCSGIWRTQWLNKIADALQRSRDPESDRMYKVTASSGLIVRKTANDSAKRLGSVSCGTVVKVNAFSGGWAQIDYSGQTAYIRMSFLQKTKTAAASYTPTGAKVYNIGDTVTVTGYPHYTSYSGSYAGYRVENYTGKITYLNLNGNAAYPVHVGSLGWFAEADVKTSAVVVKREISPRIQAVIAAENGALLNCGQFEIDSLVLSGPPEVLTIKGTALPFDSSLRDGEKSRSWENFTLKEIGKEITEKNGMGFLFLPESNPDFARVEQYRQSDISFYARLCQNHGYSVKTADNVLIVFDGKELAKGESVKRITRGCGYESYKMRTSQSEKYTSCRVSYVAPSGKLTEATAYIDKFDDQSEKNRQLEVTQRVANATEAKELAQKLLRFHNKYEYLAEFTFPGDVTLVAGQCVTLEGWGRWDGKYTVKSAKHSVGSGGYTTAVSLVNSEQ